MIAHVSEAAEILRLAISGVHVSFAGPPGSDLEGTLRHLEEELTARGYETVRLESASTLASASLAPIRLALPDVVADARDPSTVIDRFSAYLGGFSSPALLVADHDTMDPFTERAIIEATRRTSTVVVGSRSSLTASLAAPRLEPLAPVVLRRLSHLELDRWLSGLTDHPLDQELVTRLYIDTAGSPLFARVLLLGGIREGRIRLSSGLWTLHDDELWSREAAALVESSLASVGGEAQETLKSLHVLGAPRVTDALKRFSPRVVSDLERAGLVGVLRSPAGEPLIMVTPPLVSRYLDRETGSVLRAALGVEPLEAGMDEEGILAAELAQAGKERAAEAMRRFTEEPSAARAAMALSALWVAGASLGQAEELLSRVPPGGAANDRLHVAVLHARWLAFGEDRIDDGLAVLDGMRFTGTTELVRRGHRAVLAVLGHGIDRQAARELRALALLPPTSLEARWLRISIANLALLGGRARTARRLLDSIEPDPELLGLWTFTGGHAALATDDRERGVTLASAAYDRAREDRDPDLLFAAAYSLVGFSVFNGAWSEAQNVIRVARAVLRPSLYTMSIYRTAMSLQAVVLAEDGDEEVAGGVLRAVGRAGVLAPISWGQADSPDFVPALASRDYEELAELLARAADAATTAGGILSASELWAFAVALDPPRVDSALVPEKPAELPAYRRLLDFVRELTTTSDLRALVDSFEGGSFGYLAALALVRYSQLLQRDEPARSALARSLVDEYCARISIEPPAKVIEGRLPILGLTPREVEVALMASRLSNRAIAERLNISERTVDHHVSNALQKSGARNRHELSALVARLRREW